MESKSVRVNIGISAKVKKWFEDRSSEMGISQSALMAMALNEYIDQKETIKSMSDMTGYMVKFEKVFEELEKKEKL